MKKLKIVEKDFQREVRRFSRFFDYIEELKELSLPENLSLLARPESRER
jgi:hypothetical protein